MFHSMTTVLMILVLALWAGFRAWNDETKNESHTPWKTRTLFGPVDIQQCRFWSGLYSPGAAGNLS